MQLFDFSRSILGEHIRKRTYLWDILKDLKQIIPSIVKDLPLEEYDEILEGVFAHKTAKIAPSAHIEGFTIIGKDTEVRHSAFIRGSAVIGDGVVIGNSCEVKNSIIFDGAQIPHFNYVGDSIIGYKAHLGAGVILSNLKSDKLEVCVDVGGAKIATGMRKLGSLIGDCAEIGCNCVLNPGTIIGKNAIIYPLSSIRGTVFDAVIYKSSSKIVKRV